MSAVEPRGFRRWRRTRPFWGGLFAVLGGVELVAVPLAPMPVTVHQGMAGVASWLIGALLVVAGVLLWTQPAQRVFYGVLAVLLALASFLTSNFGGFLLGMLLGIVGGALGFAWTPAPAPKAVPGPLPARGRMLAFAAPVVLPLALGGHLFPPLPTPTPKPAATPIPTPAATPSPSATPEAAVKDGCPRTPVNGAGMSPDQARELLKAHQKAGCSQDSPAGGHAGRERTYDDLSTLRASSLEMSGLHYDGVTKLRTRAGEVPALRFSMSSAVLKNVDQKTRHGAAHTRLTTPGLTLTGHVVMYTTRMSSKLLGIPLTFTPERPPPLTLPHMVMTDVVSEQPAVRADGARAAALSIRN